MESVGTRWFPRICTSSINVCTPCDRAGDAVRKAQTNTTSESFSDQAPVLKAAIPGLLTSQGKETFRALSRCRMCEWFETSPELISLIPFWRLPSYGL